MKLTMRSAVLAVALAVTVPVAFADAATTQGEGGPRSSLTILVPGAAGGGYDLLARETQQALRANGISGNVQVLNIPGASGTVGLQTLVEMDDRDDVLLVVGSAMVGGVEVTDSPVTLDDVTPVSTVTTDYPVIVTPASSPYDPAEASELLQAWKDDPQGHPIAGGALGNTDHLAILALADAAGIPTDEVNYIAYSGGGEVLGALLSGTAAAGVSGYAELSDQIRAGNMNGIGTTAPERVEGIDLPTFREQGIDTVTSNWRGFVAPPGISGDQAAELEQIVAELLRTDEWRNAVERNQWQQTVLTGQDYTDFIEDEVATTRELLSGGAQ
ncbi:Bug family tripartite tricarboxylate transporter substrate binding protein [Nocardiopsis dassonvillei]|uniref:Bug family tripartite tricarboxylate transporter substrate binding protein n=1 Tax=Nocardiopsis dassonvillei TaxID=2014 RepID=UPI00157CC279|nr:tripartite tricarboxylate transporter substrate-binding protein [Nocardiopsis dassonvillei]